MDVNCDGTASPKLNCVHLCLGLAMTLTLFAPSAIAQTQSAESTHGEQRPGNEVDQTLYLNNMTQQSDANDVLTDLRNMLPRARMYYVSSSNAVSIQATPDDIQRAQKILADIDRAKKAYRITYTITETDSGKHTGAQHFSVIVTSGGKAMLKQGVRVPIITGSSDKGGSSPSSLVQYLDVGMYIDTSLDGKRLHTKVEQSSVAEEKSGIGAQDPIVRQTVLDAISILTDGKPIVLGTLDIPGTTQHKQLEVASELVQ